MTTKTQGTEPGWAQVALPEGERTLPVYLLIDTSGSMAGAPLEHIKQGLELLQKELSEDAQTAQVVKLGVITFNDSAEMIQERLVPVEEFSLPQLAAGGSTRVDLAYKKLAESIARDVAQPVKFGRKGDWKPIVFLLTDGCPTEASWPEFRDRVLAGGQGVIKAATIISVGCGTAVNDEMLKALGSGPTFRIGNDGASFASFFQFVSASVQQSLQRSMSAGDQAGVACEVPVSTCIQKLA